jgi:hypothetical protein
MIVSIFLSACSDELAEDMDNAINNPQMSGGKMIITKDTGMVLDGIKDAMHATAKSKISDISGDAPDTTIPATDVVEVTILEDNEYLWFFVGFADGAPDYNSSASFGFSIRDDRDPWEKIEILSDQMNSSWTKYFHQQYEDFSISDNPYSDAGLYYSSAEFAANQGMELRVLKIEFVNTFTFWVGVLSPDFDPEERDDSPEVKLQIE